jgi:transcriptional regulator with XRE-family HTH domain
MANREALEEGSRVDEHRPAQKRKRRKPGASRACKVLAVRVAGLGLSHREIERELGAGHGSLSNLLSGRTEIHLRHIEALAPVFGVTPRELFNDIYGEPVEQTGLPQRFQTADVECLREVLRETLREELARALKGQEP